jgi:hypothetical protein
VVVDLEDLVAEADLAAVGEGRVGNCNNGREASATRRQVRGQDVGTSLFVVRHRQLPVLRMPRVASRRRDLTPRA